MQSSDGSSPTATPVASPGSASLISEVPPLPASASTPTVEKSPLSGDDSTKRSGTLDSKAATQVPVQERKSTIKHQEPDGTPETRPKSTRRPTAARRMSTASTRSRYSEMTENYFDSIPAKYNAWAGWFTWILLAGFVMGPSAQEAASQVNFGERYKNAIAQVPLLAVSIACSGVGGLGMIWLWIRWRKNYIWLIHKIFLPGALNGLAGTLAVTVNIWAIQGGHFHFNTTTIITLSIVLGATVICLALTLIYQILLMRVKLQHRRMMAESTDEEDGAPTIKGTVSEHDFSDVKQSFATLICGGGNN